MTQPVRHQRSEGAILLSMGATGLKRLREAHAAKVRLPAGGHEAILINTGGGLAGGDRFSFDITAEEDARLTLTSQAAERVYRTLGPAAEVDVRLTAKSGATLMWLPQESILFDGASLSRRITADIAADARLLAVESVILGREAMGETVHHARLRDSWRIRQSGRLIFADDLAFDGPPPATPATLGEARAFATILAVSPQAETMLDAVRAAIGPRGDASSWSGKMVARLAARDGFELRKSLIPALTVLAGCGALPKSWSF
ncbi:urease accessory protein UreD [Aestuariivirga sp.]|uniref:urease accessory protein UreD n=1 Tax=Aestuariivirga sp. TaxID=2650926 RepID=UPI003BAD5E2B